MSEEASTNISKCPAVEFKLRKLVALETWKKTKTFNKCVEIGGKKVRVTNAMVHASNTASTHITFDGAHLCTTRSPRSPPPVYLFAVSTLFVHSSDP